MSSREIMFNDWHKKFRAPVIPVDQAPYFVCFMDLLGSSEHIKRSRDKRFVEEFHAILDICDQIDRSDSPIRIKTFSDNICLLYPIPKEKDEARLAFRAFAASVANLQTLLLMHTEEWVRGGIVAGNAFVDEHFVWGDALVSAVELEKRANIPLIEIALPTVEEYVVSNCDGLVLRLGKEHPFINYFAVLTKENIDKILKLFQFQIGNKISEWDKPITLDAQSDKIAWAVAYYNTMAKKFGYDELIFSFTDGKDTCSSILRLERIDDTGVGTPPTKDKHETDL